MSPGGKLRRRSSASSTPGTNASRENVSWRIVSSWPSPPRSTSWCATRPGSRTEWIGDVAADERGRRLRRARRRVALRVVVELDDLGAAAGAGPPRAAKRIIRTAPIAKLGAWKTATPASRAGASAASTSKPRRARRPHGTPRSSARADVRRATASGAVKSTTASPRRARHVVPVPRAPARAPPTLPPADEADPHARPPLPPAEPLAHECAPLQPAPYFRTVPPSARASDAQERANLTPRRAPRGRG